MKKIIMLAALALSACFVGCGSDATETVATAAEKSTAVDVAKLDAARAAMPEGTNILLVAQQKANPDTSAWEAVWGKDATEEGRAMLCDMLPPEALELFKRLGIDLQSETPFKGEAVAALGLNLGDIETFVENGCPIGAYLHTGANYAEVLSYIKEILPAEVAAALIEEGPWTTLTDDADEKPVKVGMRESQGGIQLYLTPDIASPLQPLESDAFLNRAFAATSADSAITVCVKGIDTLLKQSDVDLSDPSVPPCVMDIRTAYITATTTAQQLTITAEIGMTDAEPAEMMKEVINSFRTMGAMFISVQGAELGIDVSPVTNVINGIKIATKDTTVTVTLTLTPATLKDIMTTFQAYEQKMMEKAIEDAMKGLQDSTQELQEAPEYDYPF